MKQKQPEILPSLNRLAWFLLYESRISNTTCIQPKPVFPKCANLCHISDRSNSLKRAWSLQKYTHIHRTNRHGVNHDIRLTPSNLFNFFCKRALTWSLLQFFFFSVLHNFKAVLSNKWFWKCVTSVKPEKEKEKEKEYWLNFMQPNVIEVNFVTAAWCFILQRERVRVYVPWIYTHARWDLL